jgi:predicted N-acetyltransferase YhbS
VTRSRERVLTPAVDGPRDCRPEELPGVIALVDAAMRQGSDQTLLTDYPLVYGPQNLPNVSLVAVDGRPVATAPVLPRRIEGDGFAFGLGVISPTATDPHYQHRGYGSLCVRRCVERMEELGLELSVLWTAVPTFPFYELNGWQAVERFGGSFRLRREDAARLPAADGPVIALADAPERVAEVLGLHVATGDGVVRSLEQAGALFALPRMTTWLALEGDRVAAYLLQSRATNKPGLLESGGDQRAIRGLIRGVLEQLEPGATIDLQVGFAPDPLIAIAAADFGDVPAVPYDGNMMLRLNDPAAFLRSIRGWLARRLPPAANDVSIDVVDMGLIVSIERRPFGLAIGSRLLPNRIELTRRDLTSVLFGPHADRPVMLPAQLAWLSPFRVPIPVLDRS